MKSNNFYYKNSDSLKAFIDKNHIIDSSSLLIQIFTAFSDTTYIQNILNEISSYLPKSKIIGSTTDGEIMDGRVTENKTVISFTMLHNTTLDVIGVTHDDDGYNSGKKVALSLVKQNTKAIITFATCYNTFGEDYLKGINYDNNKIIVAGGIAAHGNKTNKTYVFIKNKIFERGAVAVSLNSTKLTVYNDYSYNWVNIGLELTITKAIGNRVYKIDKRTAYDTYLHYLGKKIAGKLLNFGLEFPLIIKRDNFLISRAVSEVHSDGSISFAGSFDVGDKVQFGYGDIKSIHKKSIELSKNVAQKPVETIFIYSCLARRHYLGEDITNEISPLGQIAPISGFFTHGEFYTNSKKEFLNQTMTVLVLSEQKDLKNKKEIKKISKKFNNQAISINALANLINVVSQEVKENKEELEKQRNYFEILFEKSVEGIVLLLDGKIVKCNEAAYKILDFPSKDKLIGLNPWDISPKYQIDGVLSSEKAKYHLENVHVDKEHQFEWIHRKYDGKPIWMEVRLSKIEIYNKIYHYASWRDIQKRKEVENQLISQKKSLYYQANYDDLTGLANRNLFYERLREVINQSKQKSQKVALLFIDLDMFKDINDTLGHDIGDLLLKEVSQRLRKFTRKDDVASRIGGDEFTIIMEDINGTQVVAQRAEKLLHEISKVYKIKNHSFYISCSIGISIFPDDTNNLNDLIKYADIAMYKAKFEGRNRKWFYSGEMTKVILNKMKVERELREAIGQNQLEVFYQPLINTKENKVVGAEALVRWNHPENGLIFPNDFISIAERSDLILSLDNWVMHEAMKQFLKWNKDGLNPGILSLNLTIKQLEREDYIDNLVATMEKYFFKPEWLKLEIVERQIMKKPDESILKLREIRKLGILLAIDDFGVGESSFMYLKKFPINTIKIDKSFIMNMQNNEESKEIVKAIVALGNALNLEVIAEGVESVEDRDYLIKNGCFFMQGYYFSKPVRVEEFLKFMKRADLKKDLLP